MHNRVTGQLDNEAESKGNHKKSLRKQGYPTKGGLTGWVFTRSKPLRLPNLQNRDRKKPQDHPQYNAQLEIDYVKAIPSGRVGHYLGVPMIIGNKVIGAIQLLNKKSDYYLNPKMDKQRWLLERGFSDDEENVLGIAASHLAVAIMNAELIEERNKTIEELNSTIRQLKTLKDVGRYTSQEMPLDELLSKIIEKAAKDVQAEICLLFLLDESKSKVILERCYGIPKEYLEGAYYEIGEGLTGGVAQTRKSILKANPEEGKYDKKILSYLQQIENENKTIKSLMIVPIKAKDEVFGFIKAINKKGHGEQYNPEDLNFLETFANYIGMALEHAQRYYKEQIENGRKAILSRLVRAVVHETNNTYGLIPNNIQLIREDIEEIEEQLNRMESSDILGPNNTQLIREDIEEKKSKIEEKLKRIENSAKQGVAFARSIQVFSPSQFGERTVQDINIIIEKALKELSFLGPSKPDHEIRTVQSLSHDPLECWLYEIPFIQVVRNIVINAYQAMQDSASGILTITSRRDLESNNARVEFADTGRGIKEEDVEKIFDDDYTTKGSGIGLWLVKTHLDSIDGKIKVNSTLGVETIFTIEIPLYQSEVLEEKAHESNN